MSEAEPKNLRQRAQDRYADEARRKAQKKARRIEEDRLLAEQDPDLPRPVPPDWPPHTDWLDLRWRKVSEKLYGASARLRGRRHRDFRKLFGDPHDKQQEAIGRERARKPLPPPTDDPPTPPRWRSSPGCHASGHEHDWVFVPSYRKHHHTHRCAYCLQWQQEYLRKGEGNRDSKKW